MWPGEWNTDGKRPDPDSPSTVLHQETNKQQQQFSLLKKQLAESMVATLNLKRNLKQVGELFLILSESQVLFNILNIEKDWKVRQ